MGHSVRSYLTVGIATITAATIAFVPSVKEPAPAVPAVQVVTPAVQLAAQVQPLAATDLPNLLVDFVQRIAVPPSAGQPFPTPEFPPVVGGTSIDSTVKNIYNAVEPWVQYGFELATYAVGWIPYVGWLSGQIMIFYHFGEQIVRSITFNIADWLGGNVSFGQGLVNVGIDTINAFIYLANAQLAFWLPPLPPIPPIGPFSAKEAVTEDVTALSATSTDVVQVEKHGAVEAEVVGEQAAGGATAKEQEPEVDAAKKPKEPKTPPSSTAAVAAQGEVRGAQADDTTETKKVNNGNGHKKGDKGATAEGTSESSTSAAKNDDTNANRDKKDETGKKK